MSVPTVADFADAHPQAERVLRRYGISTCCGRGEPLHAAAVNAGVTIEQLHAELAEVTPRVVDPNIDWTTAPLDELVNHLIEAFHIPHRALLADLLGLCDRVCTRHREKDPDRFDDLWALVYAIDQDLQVHMMKEEQILFPMIGAGRGHMATMPIQVMQMDHRNVDAMFERLRRITDDYQVPPEACRSWTALWEGLAELDRELTEHIALEDGILFPRALGG